MDTIQKLVDYTYSKKGHQLSKKNYFYTEPIKEIEFFSENKEDDSVVGMNFDFLSSWYHYQFIYNFLSKTRIDYNDMALSTIYAIEANNWDFFLGKRYETYSEAIQFHKAIKHMAQALLLGWDDLAVKYGHLLIDMLYGKQYEGWHPAYKHPWFMLELFCKWQKIELDYSCLNNPEDMGVYTQPLQNWDTRDTALLTKMINDLSNFHIEESDENEYKDRTPDFPSSDYFIFPIEILLWINLRERMKLPNYTSDNELMKMSINDWHVGRTEIPHIELIENAKKKLMEDYPGTLFEL